MPKKTNSHSKKVTTAKIPKEIQQALVKPVQFFFWNVSGIVEYIHEGKLASKTLNVFHRSHRPMVLAELEQSNLKLYATFQERMKAEHIQLMQKKLTLQLTLFEKTGRDTKEIKENLQTLETSKDKMLAETPDLEVKSITMLAVSYLGTFTQEQWREGIQMPQEATQEAPQTTEQPSPAVTPAT